VLQLESIADSSCNRRLIRISGNDPSACGVLMAAFAQLANGRTDHVVLSDLPDVAVIDNCQLSASVGNQNRGVIPGADSNSFDWVLTPAGWHNNAGLIEPFCRQHNGHGHQWLDAPGDVSVLLSTNGQW
jgi:hypothetical protein